MVTKNQVVKEKGMEFCDIFFIIEFYTVARNVLEKEAKYKRYSAAIL